MPRRRNARGRRDHARSERVGELLREILASELERYDDDRLQNVSLTGVVVDEELMKAVVHFDALDDEAIDGAAEAFDEHTKPLRRAVGAQARLRRIPDLEFRPDRAVSEGRRIEEILAGLDDTGPSDSASGTDEASDGPPRT